MRPGPVQSTAEDNLLYGAVHLNVTDLERSLVFWRDLIGMVELGDGESGAVRLGVKGEPDEPGKELVVLHPGATRPVQRGYSALYHLAIHMPSEAEFARILARLFAARYPNAPTDHVTHWATYLDDPDGINVEIAFETIDRVGEIDIVGGRPLIGRKTKPHLKVGVCGEHGGDPESVHFFHNAGLDYVSCSPFRVPVARLEAGRAAVMNAS